MYVQVYTYNMLYPSDHFRAGIFAEVVCYLVQHIELLEPETQLKSVRDLSSLIMWKERDGEVREGEREGEKEGDRGRGGREGGRERRGGRGENTYKRSQHCYYYLINRSTIHNVHTNIHSHTRTL